MRLFHTCPCVHASCRLRQSYRPSSIIFLSLHTRLLVSPRLFPRRLQVAAHPCGCLGATIIVHDLTETSHSSAHIMGISDLFLAQVRRGSLVDYTELSHIAVNFRNLFW